ncbi:MAG: hypothetical protein QOH35_5986 [Acidobacteriaceae bacterium]|jgi:hypothetical protein|nr:hypothetical protein [Acidobacteriaceae bacterium]
MLGVPGRGKASSRQPIHLEAVPSGRRAGTCWLKTSSLDMLVFVSRAADQTLYASRSARHAW